jgi:uncharacterized protein YcbK (DUF882 family)
VQSRKIINRRAFCAGILAASAVQASDPIVDLKKKSSPLLLPQKKQTIFQRTEKAFIDLEPAVLGPSQQLFTPEIIPNLYDQYLKLALRVAHTGEEMNLVVPKSLNISNSAMAKFSHLCRDWRYNKAQDMDPGLIRILAKICDESKNDKRSIYVEILSGFRTQRTNEMLRRRSVMVAKNSFHKLGKALDFRLPDLDLSQTRASAERYAYGGLGVYKNFIHIDTGPQRRWFM